MTKKLDTKANGPAPLAENRHCVIDMDTASGLCFVGIRQANSVTWSHDGQGVSFETAVSVVLKWRGSYDFTFRVNPGEEHDFDPDSSSAQRSRTLLARDRFGTFSEVIIDHNGLHPGMEKTANPTRWLEEWAAKQIFESRHLKGWQSRVSELAIRWGGESWEELVGDKQVA